MPIRIVNGDCREVLKTLPDESVHCAITSPPYFGLRDYGAAGQIGLEDSPDEFIAEMVTVFREVRRVLRADGTLWLNLGDTYAGGGNGGGGSFAKDGIRAAPDGTDKNKSMRTGRRGVSGVYKSKDRMMIPARVAIALHEDGWFLRDEIVWHKPNPMPSSVADRTTPAHEMIYMLTKSERYYYDHSAIREPSVSDHPSGNGFKRGARKSYQNADGSARGNDKQWSDVGGMRNKRSVWTVAVKPFSGAHFATFPAELIEDAVKAACPAGGVVLDPFGGAGTTGLVADRLGRDALLIELNPTYAELAHNRLSKDAGMFADVSAS